MIRTVLVTAGLVIGVTAAIAQADVIAQRKEIMKGVGAATRTGTQMVRGEAPYDQAKAQDILRIYADAAKRMPALFPANSKTGGDTTAAPRIWEDTPAFHAGFAKLEKEATDAAAKVNSFDSFKTAFGDLTKNCGACHETFRVKRN